MKLFKNLLPIFSFILLPFIADAATYDCGCSTSNGITVYYQSANADCCSQLGIATLELWNPEGEMVLSMQTSAPQWERCC